MKASSPAIAVQWYMKVRGSYNPTVNGLHKPMIVYPPIIVIASLEGFKGLMLGL